MFLEKKDRNDMVIGNRNKREDGFSRVLVTKTLKGVNPHLFWGFSDRCEYAISSDAGGNFKAVYGLDS